MVIIEIVIDAEVLLVVDPMVDLDRELIATLRLYRYRHKRVAVGGSGNKLQQINCCGIHAGQGNYIFLPSCYICKDPGVSSSIIRIRRVRNSVEQTGATACLSANSLGTSRALIERV